MYIYDNISIRLTMRNVSDKCCRENHTTHFVFNNFFFRKSCRLWDTVEKYGTARQATSDNIIMCMHFRCRITKAGIWTHSYNIEYFSFSHGNNGYAKALECYVICILPVLFALIWVINIPGSCLLRLCKIGMICTSVIGFYQEGNNNNNNNNNNNMYVI
jgi:hypothetical protein